MMNDGEFSLFKKWLPNPILPISAFRYILLSWPLSIRLNSKRLCWLHIYIYMPKSMCFSYNCKEINDDEKYIENFTSITFEWSSNSCESATVGKWCAKNIDFFFIKSIDCDLQKHFHHSIIHRNGKFDLDQFKSWNWVSRFTPLISIESEIYIYDIYIYEGEKKKV